MVETAATPIDTPSTASAAAPHRRWLRWLLIALGIWLAVVLAVIAIIALMDWNRLKPWVNEKVSTATGREFAINGDLQVHWTWPQPLDSGWRHWIPGVIVQASDLSLSQPAGWSIAQQPDKGSADHPALPAVPKELNTGRITGHTSEQRHTPKDAKPAGPSEDEDEDRITQASLPPPERGPGTMATVARASASLRLWPLLARHVQLDSLRLQGPDIVLARSKNGDNNWTFTPPQNDGPRWSFDIGQLRIDDGALGWSDGVKNMALRARVDSLRKPVSDTQPYGTRIGLSGYMNQGKAHAQIQAQGLMGPTLDLRQEKLHFPLRLVAKAGNLQAFAEGFLDNPRTLDGLDFQVRLRGRSMADLFDLTGLLLPATPPFDTSGHLVGSLQPGKAIWSYEKFQGKVGESDLSGDIQYSSGKPRPKLTGKMHSRQLRLVDLGPLVGAAPSGSTAAPKTSNGKVLPQIQFETAHWDKMDMDLQYDGAHIIRPQALPVQNLSVHALLNNGKLVLAPLKFGLAEGALSLDASIDSHAKPVAAQIKGQVQALKLSALFPKVEEMKKSLGRLDGAISLNGHDESLAQWLGTGNGSVKLFVRDGTFSKQLLDMAGLNVGSILVSKLFGSDKEVQLRCAVADFNVQNGLAKPRIAKLATTEAIVEATGQISLAQESMNLRIVPESLKWKFFSLRTPLYVRGSFAKPDVGLEPGPLVARAGAAVAAAVFAPVALALVPLTVPAADDDVNCKQLLAAVHAKK